MPTIVTLEDGSQQEVFTAEELEAQTAAAIDEYKTANPEQLAAVTELQDQLKAAQEELEKFKSKDLNFSHLRTQKDAAEKKVEELTQAIDQKITQSVDQAKKEVLESVVKDHYNDTLKVLTGADEELRKKVEYHYARLGDAAESKEAVSLKLKDAYLLATKTEEAGLQTAVISSGAVGRINPTPQTKTFTPEEIAFGKQLAQAGGLQLEDGDFK